MAATTAFILGRPLIVGFPRRKDIQFWQSIPYPRLSSLMDGVCNWQIASFRRDAEIRSPSSRSAGIATINADLLGRIRRSRDRGAGEAAIGFGLCGRIDQGSLVMRQLCDASVKGVSAGEVVPAVEGVGSVSRAVVIFERMKVIVMVMMVHCHRGGRQHELSLKVGDGGNREGGISWGCLTPPLLHRRSDMPCPKITSSS